LFEKRKQINKKQTTNKQTKKQAKQRNKQNALRLWHY
jgi:hypothetical protein